MGRFVASVLLLSSAPLASAIDLTPVDGLLSCPGLHNSHVCAQKIEQELGDRFPDLFAEHGDKLKVSLLDGGQITVDNPEDLLTAVDVSPDRRFLVIHEQYWEGRTWHLFDRKSGELTRIGGYPIFSPDNRRFVAIEQDLDAGYSPNRFVIYFVEDSGVELEADLGPDLDDWGPGNTSWIDETTIRFELVRFGVVEDKVEGPYVKECQITYRLDNNWKRKACK